ncbi:MAG: histidine kinase [Saprospiraceae bacterium]|nr:histidine kinase [Saprospiraceae bacterium]
MRIVRPNICLLLLSLQAIALLAMAQDADMGENLRSTPISEPTMILKSSYEEPNGVNPIYKEDLRLDSLAFRQPLNSTIPLRSSVKWNPWLIAGIISGILLAIFGLYRYQMNQFKTREKMKTAFEKKLAHVEMSALLAQMNPHFLFNSLNSIESYIVSNQTKAAAQYLNNFSRLMRLILQHSRSDYISLKEEINALELYLEMEHIRFKDKFQYGIYVARDLDTNAIDIPPMLIQPYVENAIWHGLMHKPDRSNGMLVLEISRKDNFLYCVIEDNGIGREKAQAIVAQKTTPRKRSMGMAITKDRMKIMSQLYNFNTEVKVTDLYRKNGEARGTRVELFIPL